MRKTSNDVDTSRFRYYQKIKKLSICIYKFLIFLNTNNGDYMSDKKILNILLISLTLYILILLVEKLAILKIICTILKIIMPLFIGIIITCLLNSCIDYLESKGINRIVSLISIYGLIILILYFVLKSFIPIFFKELDDFVKNIPSIIDSIKVKSIDLSEFKEDIISNVDNFIKDIKNGIPNTCMNMFSHISNIFIGFVIGFYFLISKPNISKYFKKSTLKLLIRLNIIFRGYVKGTLLSSFLVFVLSTLIFYIFKLPSALFLGFICGITNIIPFIGPYIGGIIPIFIAFTKGITFGIIITAMIFIVQTIEGNIIHPLIMSKVVNIHPVTSIISLLIFGYFFGVIGILIAVPVSAVIKEIGLYYIEKYKINIKI